MTSNLIHVSIRRYVAAFVLVAVGITAVSAVDGAVASRPTVTAIEVTR